MKNSTNFRTMSVIALLGLALAAPVIAQPGSGMGGGGGRGGGMRFGQSNTVGWSLMTQEERVEHRARMMSAKTYDECKQLQVEHRVVMDGRAKEKGMTLPAPRQNGCDRMKSRGLIN